VGMINSKLVNLLRVLSNRDLKQLAMYFNAGFFERKPMVAKLFKYLHKHYKNDGRIEKEKVFKMLYGARTTYNDLKMRHLMADVLTATEQFLMWQEHKTDALAINMNLLQYYRKKQLDKHYKGVSNVLTKMHKKTSLQDADYFYYVYKMAHENIAFVESSNARSKQGYLQEALNNFDRYYALTKLKLASAMLTYQWIMPLEYKISFLDELLTFVEKTNLLEIPMVAIYFFIVKNLINPEESDNFNQLKQLLNKHLKDVKPEEGQIIYAAALNHCARQINKGEQEPHFLKEIFELYKLGLDTKLIFNDDGLPAWHYKNIITVGLRLEKYKWVREFLYTHKDFIPKEFRESAFTYNLSNYHFFREEYEEVLLLLHKVSHNDAFYNFDSRTLLLKTYYELNYIDSLESLLDSFKQFMIRNKDFLNKRKESYRNLLKFTRRLIKVPPYDKEKIRQLKQALIESKHVASREWLLEKIDELL